MMYISKADIVPFLAQEAFAAIEFLTAAGDQHVTAQYPLGGM